MHVSPPAVKLQYTLKESPEQPWLGSIQYSPKTNEKIFALYSGNGIWKIQVLLLLNSTTKFVANYFSWMMREQPFLFCLGTRCCCCCPRKITPGFKSIFSCVLLVLSNFTSNHDSIAGFCWGVGGTAEISVWRSKDIMCETYTAGLNNSVISVLQLGG